LHADTTCYADFNFKNDDYHSLYFWELPKEIIIGYAKTYPELLESLTHVTGRLPELPEWVHEGVILGVQGGTEQVQKYKALAEKNGIRVSGLWCQDWAGINITTFGKRLYWQWEWNEERYPNLDTTIKVLNDQGTEFLAYICPFFLENEGLFNTARDNNYLVLNKDREPYIVDFGEFDCGIVDLTNSMAFEWYKTIIKNNLIALGIKGWMADFGEYLPIDCMLHNGVDPKLMHNEWPVLWARCNYEAVEETGNIGKIIYFMRAGGHGSQKYCLSLWAGDQSVNWERHDGIPSVIPACLSSGIIGNPYNHSDIGGYTSLFGNIRSKELFDRWCELSVFTAYMRSHEGNRPEQNFQFYDDEFTMKHLGKMTEIRVALKPYIIEMVKEASEKGYPLMRPIFFHYEEDTRAYDIQDSYLFGSDILVAPVLTPNTVKLKVYLPEDEWVHFWTGVIYRGGEVEVHCPVGYPPVFYRKESKYESVFLNAAGLNRY
jgi:alpha-glucosidase